MTGLGPHPDLIERLARTEVSSWTGVVWRHTFGNQPPDRTNTRGARWNPAGVEVLYASLERETALAEALHMVEVQPLAPTARRSIHRISVSLEAVADLRSSKALDQIGVSVESITGDDYSLCQAIGAAAAFIRLDGLLVPSARAPGSNLVIIFGGAETVPPIQVLSSEAVL